jgi:hypothetical protein
MEVMQPFNIPTNVNAPVREPPHYPGLTFPVFTPPAASSYGTTTPITVPWHPPDLAGAINAGLETGGRLATEFMQNRKTAQEIQAEEQASKVAIAAMADPARAQYMSAEVGPGGFTANVMSPFEAQLQRVGMGKTLAETREAQARTAGALGQTAPSQSEMAAREAQRQKEEAEAQKTRMAIIPGFFLGTGIKPSASTTTTSGFIQNPATTDQGSTNQGDNSNYLNLNF